MKEGALIIIAFKKFFNIFLNIVIFIEISLVILFFVPNILGMKTYVVTSGSMEPLYPTGSLIYVKQVDASEIKENDTITFYMEGNNIVATHQVYEIDYENKQFRTQGINNRDENGNIIHDITPVKFSSLIGEPVLCFKNLGYINRLVTTPPRNILYFCVYYFYYFNISNLRKKYGGRL